MWRKSHILCYIHTYIYIYLWTTMTLRFEGTRIVITCWSYYKTKGEKNKNWKKINKWRRWKKRKKMSRVRFYYTQALYFIYIYIYTCDLNIERKGTGRFFYAHAARCAIASASSREAFRTGKKKTSFNL